MTVSNPQNAIIAPELTSYSTNVRRIDLKPKLLNWFQKKILWGTIKNKGKEALTHKENTFTESSRKHSFKANEKFGNQKSGNYLLF